MCRVRSGWRCFLLATCGIASLAGGDLTSSLLSGRTPGSCSSKLLLQTAKYLKPLSIPQYLKHGIFPDLSLEQERTRIKARSNCNSYKDSQLVHQASGKPVHKVVDRENNIAQCHRYGHVGVEKPATLCRTTTGGGVLRSFTWSLSQLSGSSWDNTGHEDSDNWDKQIPTVLMGYRATKQAFTKFSPFFMLHGLKMVRPTAKAGQ